MLNEATKANLRRKSSYVDRVQMHGDIPLWSYVEISATELCNRRCEFCPRVDPNEYPNQPLHAAKPLIAKIAAELHSLSYEGVVTFCGYGEPTLHPDLADLVSYFGSGIRVELVTNGDFLSRERIEELIGSGVDYFVVSLYDGPHQVPAMKALFKGMGEQHYLLRDRWHTAADGFGLKLTNRAGAVTVGDQDPVDPAHECFYPSYQITVDWNGDVLLCPQDWAKRVKYGNLNEQSLLEIWTSRAMHKRRMQLIRGDRSCAPCSGCNADGTLHGHHHAPLWK